MILERILATKDEEVRALRARTTSAQLERQIASMAPCKGFRAALLERPHRQIGLIAEVKKASPSKGIIRADFDPVALAKAYEFAKADCLSVLTDERYFQGSNHFLQTIREQVDLPILRKEFIVDEMQILEARVIGADAILLIAAALSKQQMRVFQQLARDIGMDVLVEVHDQYELHQALDMEAQLLGINNRNLKTFVTDIRLTEQLMTDIPADTPVVSESGIASTEDVAYLHTIGAKALLIGETFMRQADVALAVNQLMEPIS
jgi:indole-3-glycerol phosphate synthase